MKASPGIGLSRQTPRVCPGNGRSRLALQFEKDEAVPDGIRRILDETLQSIGSDLRDKSLKRHRAVHEARRGCKRIRALLRMVRDELGPRWNAEDQWYRELAGSLSPARDAEICVLALDRIRDRFGPLVKKRVFEGVRKELAERRHEARSGAGKLLKKAAQEVDEARRRTRDLPLGADGFQALAPGLSATWERARQLREQAAGTGRPEDFHHLRKRVKNLYFQLGTLAPAAPARIETLEEGFDGLGELLGDAQDLHILRVALRQQRAGLETDVVVGLACTWERQLHEEALELGGELLARAPEDLVADLETGWRKWREASSPG